jgi:hypothetical protein
MMSDLHKAAQALVDRWDTPLWKDAPHTGQYIDALRAALAQPEQEPYPLPDSLYPDSKDWVASDYAGRAEWLHFMYESKKREVEQLETAQPEQEPVAWIRQRDNTLAVNDGGLFGSDWTPLYYAALAQPEQEPVAYRFQSPATEAWLLGLEPPVGSRWEIEPLYAAPPQRQPLTDDQLMSVLPGAVRLPPGWRDFARAIEKAHGIGVES